MSIISDDYDWNTAAIVRLTTERDEARAEVERLRGNLELANDGHAVEMAELRAENERLRDEAMVLREALESLEGACASVASWSEECLDYSDATRVAARKALAETERLSRPESAQTKEET